MKELLNQILFEYSYVKLFGLSTAYFSILYFIIGPIFLYVCKALASNGLLHKIETRELRNKQIKNEVLRSCRSIIIFGFSIVPIIYLIRGDHVTLLPDTGLNVLFGLLILSIFNEIHFYVVHRMLHQPWMMKHVHHIHHSSVVPTIYSVFSFHWFEAFLLSTVPLCIVPFVPISFVAVMIYPLVSVLINYAGHCNYRLGNEDDDHWWNFGIYHNKHHTKGKKNYGFALYYLDKIFNSKLKKR